ncbi:carbon catabolite-derepressing protein kinase [Histoplasma ohiense]|nr:carbon catabolite-derepressing protein kinase [Histoplasma ohiense (nom. inval.)]
MAVDPGMVDRFPQAVITVSSHGAGTSTQQEPVRQGRERSSPQALDDAAIRFIDPSLIHQGAANVEQNDLNNLPEFVINSTFDGQLFFDPYIASPQE